MPDDCNPEATVIPAYVAPETAIQNLDEGRSLLEDLAEQTSRLIGRIEQRKLPAREMKNLIAGILADVDKASVFLQAAHDLIQIEGLPPNPYERVVWYLPSGEAIKGMATGGREALVFFDEKTRQQRTVPVAELSERDQKAIRLYWDFWDCEYEAHPILDTPQRPYPR